MKTMNPLRGFLRRRFGLSMRSFEREVLKDICGISAGFQESCKYKALGKRREVGDGSIWYSGVEYEAGRYTCVDGGILGE